MNNINLKISNSEKHFKTTPDIDKKFVKEFSKEEKQKLAKSAKDFESLLTNMMLKSMTKTTGGLFGDNNYGGDVFDTVFQQKISSYMTDSKSFGVADEIYKGITGEKLPNGLNLTKQVPTKELPVLNNKSKIKEEYPSISPSKNTFMRLEKYNPIIDDASGKFKVDKNLIKSIILTESAAKPDAVSHAKAKGLMQLMDGTAKDMGVRNSFDPKDNINGGTKYFSKMFEKFGDVKRALAAYNAGPGNVMKYDGIPPFKETKNYVNRVLGYYNYLESKNEI